MNARRRSLLKLFGGAALSLPARSFAEPLRILPDPEGAGPAPIAGQTSPELERMVAGVVPGPAVTQGALSAIWLEAPRRRAGRRFRSRRSTKRGLPAPSP